MKKLTVLCLFIDFEKAFDSVWKKGLIVKLWKTGVHGCYLSTIDSFLFGRTVSLLLNGFIGPVRACLDYGLPQGSVLSPVLFKFFVFDIEVLCMLYEQIEVFKFADDGTIKVTGKDLEECLFYMNLALSAIGDWTTQWRMVINCEVNKTEVICFNCKDISEVPKTFQLCGNVIYLTDSSKVLGITVDKQLSFKLHSQAVYNKLIYRWVCMSRYTNRNWGMNQKVLVRLAKTVMFPALFYGSIIWQTTSNMTELNRLWYKVSKSAVGAVFNVQNSILEVILGIPPLSVTNRILTVKHYLKVLSSTEYDFHLEFIAEQIAEGNSTIIVHLKDVMKFLSWKVALYPASFGLEDALVISHKDASLLCKLSKKACLYTKGLMKQFTEFIWQESLCNQLQVEGWSDIPKVSTTPLSFPLFTGRESEVLIMSFFYKNNLLNPFLFSLDRTRWKTPLCSCAQGDQTSVHLLTSCDFIEERLKDQASHLLQIGNCVENIDELPPANIAMVNCSRDPSFIRICKEIVENDRVNLRKKISLHQGSSLTRSTHT